MTLADRIRAHLADHGPATNKDLAQAMAAPIDQVANATRRLVAQGDCIAEPRAREGKRAESLFTLCAAKLRAASPQVTAALNDLARAWA